MDRPDEDYRYHLAVGSHGLAQRLTQLEKDEARKERKRRVLEKKTELLTEIYPELKGLESAQFSALPSRVGRHEDEETRRTLLIDLTFSDPFAPYELKFTKDDMDEALGVVAETLGLARADVTSIRKAQAAAVQAHVKVTAGQAAAIGVGAATVLALGGYLLIPVIAPLLGAAAVPGLAGAAATSHGLALLGGGSIAAGGWGMAGGTWLVAGVGGVTGLAAGSGAKVMMEIGASASKAELVKLQVTYREVLLRDQTETAKAQRVVKDLARRQDELRGMLAEERRLNDRNAHRVEELEKTLEAVEHSLGWMKKQRAA